MSYYKRFKKGDIVTMVWNDDIPRAKRYQIGVIKVAMRYGIFICWLYGPKVPNKVEKRLFGMTDVNKFRLHDRTL